MILRSEDFFYKLPTPSSNLTTKSLNHSIPIPMGMPIPRADLQMYRGNFLLMDNKHKLFVIKQSKDC